MAITTGSVALAADITDLVYIVRKTADESVNNSAVFQNDDELLLPMAANEVWYVKMFPIVNTLSTADIKYKWTVPAGGEIYQLGYGVDGAGADQIFYGLNAMQSNGIGADATYPNITLEGIVVNGANAGNLQLQWAQLAAQVGNCTVKVNSCIIAHRILPALY